MKDPTEEKRNDGVLLVSNVHYFTAEKEGGGEEGLEKQVSS